MPTPRLRRRRGAPRPGRRAPFSPVSVLVSALVLAAPLSAQEVDDDQTGAWYMAFWNASFGDGPWGLQGDVQYRNWDLGGDLEQLLVRGGVTWTSAAQPFTLTAGAAHITSGAFGEGDATTAERRIYQELLIRQTLGSVVSLRHRYRTEQRWVDDQDFRTRYRYALFADVALNGRGASEGAVYLALYDEIFVNGERRIGDGRRVQLFDRNRLYGALGWAASDRLKVQGGYMLQTLPGSTKGQVQISLHASF